MLVRARMGVLLTRNAPVWGFHNTTKCCHTD
ncbi:MAG: hypothetical protein A07HR60_00231, partial [uncultured archaeon A07HR60]